MRYLIASALPAIWIFLAVCSIGTPKEVVAPGEVWDGGIVATVTYVTVSIAATAFFAGSMKRKDDN